MRNNKEPKIYTETTIGITKQEIGRIFMNLSSDPDEAFEQVQKLEQAITKTSENSAKLSQKKRRQLWERS